MQGGMAEMAQSDGEIENSVLCKIHLDVQTIRLPRQ